MRSLSIFVLSLFCFLALFSPGGTLAGSNPEKGARVSCLNGEAFYSQDGGKSFRPLKLGGEIPAGALVRTVKGARLEFELPDGSFLRMAGNSRMKLDLVEYQPDSKSRNFRFHLGLGRLWAKARDIAGKRSRFEVETANAVTGVRGTVFRINVNLDKATVVKVYQGSILLRSPREVFRPPAGAKEKRVEVPGPREVAPPEELSRAEWELLVKAMQEVYISPDGRASRPRRFSLEEDLDDWVRWNLERDKMHSF